MYVLAFNLIAPAIISSWQLMPSLALTASRGAIGKSEVALLVSIDSVCDLAGRVGAGAITDINVIRVRCLI